MDYGICRNMEQLEDYERVLDQFISAMRAYLHERRSPHLEEQVLKTIPATSVVIRATKQDGSVIRGGLRIRGFRNYALLEPQLALQAAIKAKAVLETEREAIPLRRRDSFYWLGRLLEVVVGYPLLLASLLLQIPLWQVQESGAALILTTLGIAADIAIILEALHAFRLI